MAEGRGWVPQRPKLLDGVDAFHAAYANGRVASAPELYMDLILIPAVLHVEPMTFWRYPPVIREQMRKLFLRYVAGGWAGNWDLVRR